MGADLKGCSSFNRQLRSRRKFLATAWPRETPQGGEILCDVYHGVFLPGARRLTHAMLSLLERKRERDKIIYYLLCAAAIIIVFIIAV